MQVARVTIILALACGIARADDASIAKAADTEPPIDLRLTLSSFVYRQSGADAPPIVDMGAPVENASPVHRYFGDLRMELTDGGFAGDARVRQTTTERFQSGAASGGEYELRTLSYRLGGDATSLTLGRQYVEAVGATKIDGAAFAQRLAPAWTATLFAGAFPELGSRSLDTDYPELVNPDGTKADALIPITGGAGVSYKTPDYHGDLGLATVYVAQDVPNATTTETSRVFGASSGYWRPATALSIYHFAIVDVAGANGVHLTNGSLGIDAHPTGDIQLNASVNHVSTDLLQIAARNVLADPDPTAIGIVQNNVALIRVSQDVARAGASLAFAEQRFELSASGGFHRRPSVSVQLSDGTGEVVFPEAKSVDATLMLRDRRSIAGLRASLAASMTFPLPGDAPRARGTVIRAAASRAFADDRVQIEADLMGEHFRDDNGAGMCAGSLDVFACYGSSTTTAAQAGALVTWRLAREWLLLADTHLGYQDISGTSIAGPLVWPHVYSVTAFARVQWRYR
jgi:hypothetical protein